MIHFISFNYKLLSFYLNNLHPYKISRKRKYCKQINQYILCSFMLYHQWNSQREHRTSTSSYITPHAFYLTFLQQRRYCVFEGNTKFSLCLSYHSLFLYKSFLLFYHHSLDVPNYMSTFFFILIFTHPHWYLLSALLTMYCVISYLLHFHSIHVSFILPP